MDAGKATTLQRAQTADLDLLLTFMEEYYRFDRLPFDRNKAEAALRMLMENNALGRVWLIHAGSDPVGYLVLTLGYSLEYGGRDAFIDELYLRADYRRQGRGLEAMALVAGEAQRLGVRALHLEVERENGAAQVFHRKAGYTDHDRYLMTKLLEPDPA